MRRSRLVATFAAVCAALATVGAASASASATRAPAPSVPATTDTVVPSGSISATGDDELSAQAVEVLEMESEFAHCMRENGIANYPDPQVNDDGIIVVGVPFGEQGNSEMDSAREACQHIYQQGGPPESPATPPVGRRSCPAATASVPTAASSPSGNAAPTRPRLCSTSTAAAPVGPPKCARSLETASRSSTTGTFTTVPRLRGDLRRGQSRQPVRRLLDRLRAVLHRRRASRQRHP